MLGHRGPCWEPFGPSWGLGGPTWRAFWALLEALDAVLGRPGGPYWAVLARNGLHAHVTRYGVGHVRPSWAILEAILGVWEAILGAILGPLGGLEGPHGPSWTPLGRFLGPSWAVLGHLEGPESRNSGHSKNIEKPMVFQ